MLHPLDEPFGPDSIAGIRIGDPKQDAVERLGPPKRRTRGRDESLDELLWYDGLVLGVDAGRRVRFVNALPGYRGVGPQGIRIGMTWRELQEQGISLTYSDDTCMSWTLDDHKDLYIELCLPPSESVGSEFALYGEDLVTTDSYIHSVAIGL
jgi:hypothetical protein